MKKLGNLWVDKDDKNRTFLKGFLFIEDKLVRGRKRVWIVKATRNNAKTKPTSPDFILYDVTPGEEPLLKPTIKRE